MKMMIVPMLCPYSSQCVHEAPASQDLQDINTKSKTIYQSPFLPLTLIWSLEIFTPAKKHIFQFSVGAPEMLPLP